MNNVLAVPGVALCVAAGPVWADFVEDSSLDLGLRNFYYDRDFKKDDALRSRVGNWSQGFDLRFKSGYTEGDVQFALEASSQFAFRLDGGGGRGPDAVIPYDRSRSAQAKEYGRYGVTGKIRYSKSELKIGEHRPTLPVAYLDDSRLLVTTYQGATLEMKEWDNLSVNAGRFWSASPREGAGREDLYLFGTSPKRGSDGLNFVGGDYAIAPRTSVSYYYAQLEDVYRQNYMAFSHGFDLGAGYSLTNDVRFYRNTADGSRLGGDLDNRSLGLKSTLRKAGHAFTLGYQRMDGDAFPLMGYSPQPFLVNWSTIAFYQADERSWQARYDYDFAASGVPGLKFMSRYIRGTHIDRGADRERGVESERNFVVNYVVQSGAFKGLGLEVRNTLVKSRYGADFDENRVATTYTWNIW